MKLSGPKYDNAGLYVTGELTLADYQKVGGVQGSIEAAIASALAEPAHTPAIPAAKEAQLAAMRAAFIPWLARVDKPAVVRGKIVGQTHQGPIPPPEKVAAPPGPAPVGGRDGDRQSHRGGRAPR